MSTDKQSVATGGRLLGFFTVLLILTLDASNGKDLIDVIVPYVESLTVTQETSGNKGYQ